MDVITMSSVVQHGLIQRDRIFTVSVLIPDKPGELVRVRRFRKKQPINYEILIQVKYLEISVETVAEEYGLTKSGVNNRIYKAKRWLQEEFRKVYE